MSDNQELPKPLQSLEMIDEAVHLSFDEFFKIYGVKSPCCFRDIKFVCKGDTSVHVNGSTSLVMIQKPNVVYISVDEYSRGILLSGDIIESVIIFLE